MLAYSGGLDTSVILRWLQDHSLPGCLYRRHRTRGYRTRPHKAELMGIKKIFIEDLREEFVRDYVFQCSGPTHSMRVSLGYLLLGH